MDLDRFDTLTRGLAAADWTRRHLVRTLAGCLLAAFFAGDGHGASAKRKRKKRKKRACTPTCANKNCGDSNGCGGRCVTQQGCGAGQTCDSNGQCVQDTCNPACTGANRVCIGGECVCRGGTKECPGGFGNCHECCQDSSPWNGDSDCEGSPNGAYCRDNDGDLVLTCGCFSSGQTCPSGQCGVCCSLDDCFLDVFGEGPVDTGRDCVVVNQETGEYGCRCRSGTYACPDFTFCAEPGNVRACGAKCEDCNRNRPYQNYVCEGNPERCCLPTGSLCAGDNQRCCSGPSACVLNAEGTTYVCA